MSVIILKTNEKRDTARKIINRLKLKRGLKAKKYCGKINLPIDPLDYQKRIRDEWQ